MNVALAISSYGGDRDALARVGEAHDSALAGFFSAIVIVDSGDEHACLALQQEVATSYPDVEYQYHAGNLGSAGNLVARLRWARSVGAEALLAVNADGHLTGENVRLMAACLDRPDVGAAYTTYVIGGRHVNLSGRRRMPVLPSRRSVGRLQRHSVLPVHWGSSNGALYRVSALDHVHLDRLSSLWYGWEDLAIGLELDAGGLRQLLCIDAAQPTTDDLRPLGQSAVMVYDKPPWATYYSTRNLVLLARWHPRLAPATVLRILRELLMIAVRDRRGERLSQGLRGISDGLRNRTGQRVAPAT